ncbi:Integrase core domain-containing protein [Paenacidovorax caeni]|uniref:Integrase core domain-containing protein n=1 Tax=Paenacidovorax caeni TaxID=343013 RepID=A0A1I7JEU0_9BURK|nr:IS21 family transposase [Paenacidovorax caeni]SFU83688.1 Integrase core domain-containing protein [Paenacidovorax caeni]
MNVLKPHLQTTIWTLLKGGATQREIERITGISRHTIRAYQQRLAADPTNCPGVATDPPSQTAPPWPPTSRPASLPLVTSKCEPHHAFIDTQLRLGRNATAIYQDLVDQHGFDGAYNSVKRFVARLRHKEPEQFDRLSFAPGEEMQVDYGEGAPTRVPGTERWRKPRLFVATLRYSRRSFRRVVWKSSQQVWAELHEQAWRYFGGSCRYVVLDNLKEGVLKPDLYRRNRSAVRSALRQDLRLELWAEFEILGTDSFMPPPLEGGLTDAPKFRELLLVEVGEVHLGFLPYELAGVHEGAVPRVSQAIVGADPFAAKKRSWRISENRVTFGVNGCQFGIEIATVSRSGNSRPNHAPITPNIPDREISLALSPVAADNFPNGKLSKQ